MSSHARGDKAQKEGGGTFMVFLQDLLMIADRTGGGARRTS